MRTFGKVSALTGERKRKLPVKWELMERKPSYDTQKSKGKMEALNSKAANENF